MGNRILSAGRQVSRLSALVERLLDVSQLSAGRLVLTRDEVDLAALVADAVARLRDEAQAVGSPLTLHLEAPLTGRFDRLRMDQVVTNHLRGERAGPRRHLHHRASAGRRACAPGASTGRHFPTMTVQISRGCLT